MLSLTFSEGCLSITPNTKIYASLLKNKKMFTAEQRFNIEIKHYEKGFISYGLLPTLLLLEQYEAEENYLECFYIKTAIDNLNKRHDQDFPTRYGKNALKCVKAVYDEKTWITTNTC